MQQQYRKSVSAAILLIALSSLAHAKQSPPPSQSDIVIDKYRISTAIGMDLGSSILRQTPFVNIGAMKHALELTINGDKTSLTNSQEIEVNQILTSLRKQKKNEENTLPTPADVRDIEKISTLIGTQIGRGLLLVKDEIDIPTIEQAIEATINRRGTSLNYDEALTVRNAFIERIKNARQTQQANAKINNLIAGAEYLKSNQNSPGIITTSSGLQYRIERQGSGQVPTGSDSVVVHYVGTKVDGTKFDSSYDRGQPATFPLNGVIKGWSEGLQLMPVGSKYKLFIPANLAYGENAPDSVGPNQVLIFEVELLDIKSGGSMRDITHSVSKENSSDSWEQEQAKAQRIADAFGAAASGMQQFNDQMAAQRAANAAAASAAADRNVAIQEEQRQRMNAQMDRYRAEQQDQLNRISAQQGLAGSAISPGIRSAAPAQPTYPSSVPPSSPSMSMPSAGGSAYAQVSSSAIQKSAEKEHEQAGLECLHIDDSSKFGGMAPMVNSCDYSIDYSFCYVGSDVLSGFDCTKQGFGSDRIAANSKQTIYYPGGSVQKKYIAGCVSPSLNVEHRYTGSGITFHCR